ncbi:MAG TPA: hypothetical protein VG965_02720 [Patescibacteria group bacterium]|nr:hypothetical protein [Patescibacteria group bacterium]
MKIKEFIPLIAVFLVALALRVIWLDSVPTALAGDELYYILAIKSAAISGHDLAGNWNILSSLLFQYPHGFPQAELSFLFLYPVVSLLPLSIFASKITYVILSALTVIPMYLLSKKLFDERTALAAAALTAINPWQIFNGRTTYEMIPAAFFYVFAIYLLLQAKGWKILWVFPVFLLAFYSYIATKIILFPIILAVSIFAYFHNKKKYGKQYLILNILSLILIMVFTLIVSHSGGNRVGEIFTPANPEVIKQVNNIRQNSISDGAVSSLLDNKFTVYIRILIAKAINVFSFNYLFISTDPFVALYNHGLFYYVDLIFLFLGCLYMFAEKKKVFLLVMALIVISIFPHILHLAALELFTPHLALFLTFLLIPIAYGVSKMFDIRHKVVPIAVVGVYVLSFLNFFNIYFFQYPLLGHFDFAARELANYTRLASANGPITDYVMLPEDSFKRYIYYENELNSSNFNEINTAFATHKYKLGNVTFDECGKMPKKLGSTTAIYQTGECATYENPILYTKIAILTDGGPIYRIYNDHTCADYNLKGFPKGIKISDFSVENLTPQRFCETFVTR